MYKISPTWFEILSDLFVDLAASLFIIIFIEPVLMPFQTLEDYIILTYKLVLGILFLVLAKKFKEVAKK